MDEKERRRIRMKRVAEEFVKNVGKVIRQHRIDSGLSQDDLADGIVMGRSIIGKYERGEGEISASAMAKISVYLKFPLREYTYDVINKELGDKPEDILKYLIKINEAKRTDEIEKKLRQPFADYAPVTETIQDMIIEPRQMTIEDYMDSNGQIRITPEEKPQPVRKPKKYKGYGYVTASENELMETESYLREVTEVMPLYKKTSIANIYQAIATQIEEAQGNDVKELAQIAKATVKYAINDAPAKQRKRIEAYLDYMSDGNLAYKYGEYPWKEWREEPKE